MSAQRFSVRENVDGTRRSIQTMDGKMLTDTNHPRFGKERPTQDTVIRAEVGAFNPKMFGRNWIGILTSSLADVPTKDRKAALNSLRAALDSYEQGISSGEMGHGPAG